MRGRQIFRVFRPLLIALSSCFCLLPKSVCNLLLVLLRNIPTRVGVAVRYALLKRLARACGDNVAIHEGVYLFGCEYLSLGDNVSIHPMCYINAEGGISIGSDVSIGHCSTIVSTVHDIPSPSLATKELPCRPSSVSIGDDVLVYAGVRIVAGVSIGSHSLVGAGAVVIRDIPNHSLAVGVPAKVVKQIKESKE